MKVETLHGHPYKWWIGGYSITHDAYGEYQIYQGCYYRASYKTLRDAVHYVLSCQGWDGYWEALSFLKKLE